MISRYALYDTRLLEQRYGLSSGLPKGVRPRYNISPTMLEPVIVQRDGVRAIELMQWGLVANGSKDTNSVFRYKTYNVPSEKILMKHSWETAVRQSRCLVPANGIYLLSTDNTSKRADFVSAQDGSLLSLAGIHSTWTDAAGQVHNTYSVITTEPTDALSSLTDRLPIIVHPDDEADWLDSTIADANSLYRMFRAYSFEQLRARRVGTDVYSPKIDTPDLIG